MRLLRESKGKIMIYITGDTHGEFQRFSIKNQKKQHLLLTKEDYIIVCGDFGLLWEENKKLSYDLKWLSNLPFTLLWIAGNHENYNMIEKYKVEKWKGGKVRHIIRDKVILLERGQIFTIEGKVFFVFGGASSHDIQGGILNREDEDFKRKLFLAKRRKLNYRIVKESWWQQEIPTPEELQEGMTNLALADYKVDYIISHCASNRMQTLIESNFKEKEIRKEEYDKNCLTDYFDELEEKLQFSHWYFGHYHKDWTLDKKHTLLYKKIMLLKAEVSE